ncbi:MAG: hypothetical protein LKI94_02070 [Sporolactobacillus sp.]|jgi:hypothetical protein|nr:hypothetical protein [Sporolactobacillus sp.]
MLNQPSFPGNFLFGSIHDAEWMRKHEADADKPTFWMKGMEAVRQI